MRCQVDFGACTGLAYAVPVGALLTGPLPQVSPLGLAVQYVRHRSPTLSTVAANPYVFTYVALFHSSIDLAILLQSYLPHIHCDMLPFQETGITFD